MGAFTRFAISGLSTHSAGGGRRSCRHLRLLVTSGSIAALAMGLSAPGKASETRTYTYDARGRLVAVTSSGSVNNGRTTSYCYDKADNRTQYASDLSGTPAGCTTAPALAPKPDPASAGATEVARTTAG